MHCRHKRFAAKARKNIMMFTRHKTGNCVYETQDAPLVIQLELEPTI